MSRERCGWCGRLVTRFIVRDPESDHGPLRVVWCTDVASCNAARAAQPRRATSQTPAIRGRR